jgi:hypothetical protein
MLRPYLFSILYIIRVLNDNPMNLFNRNLILLHIFSNLSRGLPIDEGTSNTESLNEQEGDVGDNSNPATDQEQQQ